MGANVFFKFIVATVLIVAGQDLARKGFDQLG